MRPGRSASVEEGSGGETNPESLQEKQAGVLSVPMTEEGESNKHPRLREAARAVGQQRNRLLRPLAVGLRFNPKSRASGSIAAVCTRSVM
jgi:hypothetical protein